LIAVKLYEATGDITQVEIASLVVPPDYLIYRGRLFSKWLNAGLDDTGCWRYGEEDPIEVEVELDR
jgi:hypothetical protein